MPTTNLSRRGEAAGSYVGENLIWDVTSNLWHPEDNPEGFVSLGVAENALMHEELSRYIMKNLQVPHGSLTYGDGPTGSKRLRGAMSRFLTKRLHPVTPIRPEHIITTNGLTTAIEHCSWALADPGEGLLLGQPYYRAFLADISLRPGVKVVPVPFGETDPCGVECAKKYEEALLKSNAEGVKVRGLMLCHPHNPLGRCYSREAIVALMRLCQKHSIHLISDEIYALSVWENTIDSSTTTSAVPSIVKFESASSIDTQGIIDPSLVHILWGMSKDFGANGLRMGAVISQSNQPLLDACRTCALYSSQSSLSDYVTAEILSDDTFVEEYIQTNQSRLSEAYSVGVQALKKHKIDYAPGANASFFLWINLGKAFLEQHPEEATRTLNSIAGEGKESVKPALTDVINQKLMANKIFLASGDVTGAEEPGWFRLVFSQPRDYVEEGMRRIVDAID